MAVNTNAIAQVKQFWASRNGRQKGFLIGGAAAVGLLMAVFVRLIGTPNYKPLSMGLEPADAQALATRLNQAGISYETSPDGKTISVPAEKLAAARMQMASDQDLHSGQMGFELFDKSSWGETEFDEKVTYQRALEGELARSIETLDNVESARVNLAMPADTVFLDQQQGAKASVVLKLRSGTLTKEEAFAISRLVAGAVNQLKPEDVAIVDADSGRFLNGGEDAMDSGGSNDLTARLISTLEPVVGVGQIRASVNVDYDQSTIDESQEKYDPSVSAVLSDQKTDQQSQGSDVTGGVPGTTSNIPSAKKSKPTITPAAQRSTSENAQYGVNKTIVHTIIPAGRIERITAAILVDDAVVKSVQKGKVHYTRRRRSQAEMDQIRSLAEAAIGFDAKRGDSISIENIAFDADSLDGDATPSRLNQLQQAVVESSPVLRPLSIVLLFVLAYLFVIRPLQRHVLSAVPAAAAVPAQLVAQAVEALPAPERELSSLRAAELKDHALEMLRQNPLQTTRSVQAWLREENS